jgi:hypothetical protein
MVVGECPPQNNFLWILTTLNKMAISKFQLDEFGEMMGLEWGASCTAITFDYYKGH